MKVVINEKGGGFWPSDLAVSSYFLGKGFLIHEFFIGKNREIKPKYIYYTDPKDPNKTILSHRNIIRHDPDFVEIVSRLGEQANTENCRLKIVDIPDGVEYIICENDAGEEWIAEKHRTWGT